MRTVERALWACVVVSIFFAAALVMHERAGADQVAPLRPFGGVSTTSAATTTTTTIATTTIPVVTPATRTTTTAGDETSPPFGRHRRRRHRDRGKGASGGD